VDRSIRLLESFEETPLGIEHGTSHLLAKYLTNCTTTHPQRALSDVYSHKQFVVLHCCLDKNIEA
jgi:hypothetical protein